MKVTHDNNAVYIYLKESGKGLVTYTETIPTDPDVLINLDYDDNGKLVGVNWDETRK